MSAPEPPPSDRIWTIPNALSVLRLLGVPLFLWLALGPKADGWAVILLMVGGFTDYLDGKIARRYNLTSKLGALLDPAADRLYILATLFALTDRHIVPLWLAAAVVGRDVVLSIGLLVLRHYGFPPPEVHFLGKAATLNLLYAFPLLLLSVGDNTLGHAVRPLAWAFTSWGAALYVWTGLLYLIEEWNLIAGRTRPEVGS
ncbi:MAG: CDP-alcohol phosphatidyltransferase family protein [Frankiaceae bacterium]|nr:CDP-alcohol phosphatidyltransferase family protein [Frankiaceae bacterium]MBV9869228.1 CDP-alcohol phosphatidyltransferase family protein [Frankiaceae bacterium]